MSNNNAQDLKAYRKLCTGSKKLLRTLQEKKVSVEKRKRDAVSNDWKLVYEGQIIELNNMIIELTLVISRAHYHIKYANV